MKNSFEFLTRSTGEIPRGMYTLRKDGKKNGKDQHEELMKKLNLTEEEMEKVAGGDIIDVECRNRCISQKAEVLAACLSVRYKVCVALAEDFENECLSEC